jgi:hypothetical protein
VRFFETVGIETALFPHLYPKVGMCETYVRRQDERRQVRDREQRRQRARARCGDAWAAALRVDNRLGRPVLRKANESLNLSGLGCGPRDAHEFMFISVCNGRRFEPREHPQFSFRIRKPISFQNTKRFSAQYIWPFQSSGVTNRSGRGTRHLLRLHRLRRRLVLRRRHLLVRRAMTVQRL